MITGGAMARLAAWTVAFALAGCASSPSPPVDTYARSGELQQVVVGSPMVNNRSTTVVVRSMMSPSPVDGSRAEFVYLGLLGSDPAGRNTVRVRYEEHKIADGVEVERPEYWAEVTLDLSRSRVIEFKGWRIGVVDATDSSIQYEILGVPAR
jgi:hypothetical protein